MSHWQTYAALGIVLFAVIVAARMLVLPFVRSFSGSAATKESSGGCGGGCSSGSCSTKQKS